MTTTKTSEKALFILPEATPLTVRPGITLRHYWSGEGNLSYLLLNEATREAVLIDPDLEILGTYLLLLDAEELTLKAVIDTHNHAEHATAAPALKKLTGAEYLMHKRAPSSFVTDRLEDRDTREIGGIPFEFFHAPGHTQELMVIKVDNHLFTGDSLFNKSCGRADLPGGDPGMQYDSLQMLAEFDDKTVIHPGHDYNHQDSITMGEAKKLNPRLQFKDRDEFIRFMDTYYQTNEKPDDLMYYVTFNAR